MTDKEYQTRYETILAIESPQDKANAMNILAWELKDQSRFEEATALCEEAMRAARIASSELQVGAILNTLANIASERGEFSAALTSYRQAITIFESLGDKYWLGTCYGNCGNIYKELSYYPLALEYYQKALSLYEEINNHQYIPVWLGNIGNVYHNMGEYSIALEYHQRALAIREEFGPPSEMGTILSNIGNLYFELAEYEKAMEYYHKSLALEEENGEVLDQAIDYGNVGRVYAKQEFDGYDPEKAEEFLLKAGALFEELGNKKYIYEFNKIVSDHYRSLERWKESDTHFRKYHKIEKEVLSEEAKKQAEQMEQRRKAEEAERDRQVNLARFQEREKILDNILPSQITERLIKGENPIADRAEHVSVFFSDIVGFTTLSRNTSAKDLVSGLNTLFIQYDALAKKHGLEKIKTIGDAYMAVCGVPIAMENHAERMAHFALDVQALFLSGVSIAGHSVNVRIGLHCGEVVAGVIGEQKFAYDLWGDTVNTASRMESHGEPGKIHVSEEFMQAIAAGIDHDLSLRPLSSFPSFQFVERGEMEIKGKGKMKTYFLEYHK
jgi:class 3 adenylate cyclase/Tfp pilus assembly protein PilF